MRQSYCVVSNTYCERNMSSHLQLFTETLKETIFSRTSNNDYNFTARNAAPSNIKVLLAKIQSLLMIFKASFHTKGHPLVVLFICISSSNSYNNIRINA